MENTCEYIGSELFTQSQGGSSNSQSHGCFFCSTHVVEAQGYEQDLVLGDKSKAFVSRKEALTTF